MPHLERRGATEIPGALKSAEFATRSFSNVTNIYSNVSPSARPPILEGVFAIVGGNEQS